MASVLLEVGMVPDIGKGKELIPELVGVQIEYEERLRMFSHKGHRLSFEKVTNLQGEKKLESPLQ